MSQKVGLIILDGWGKGLPNNTNAIHKANTPFFDDLVDHFPTSSLITYGTHVGLPEGQMGNSEVGHLNIGAGRVVYQDLAKINKALEDQTFFSNPVLKRQLEQAKIKNRIHLMGLVSDGGVHSHIDHLKALIRAANIAGIANIFVHAFTDGRDCDPHSGLGFMKDLEAFCDQHNAHVCSVIGRYYAMDRDLRWERIAKCYNLLLNKEGAKFQSAEIALETSYEQGISDEFIEPIVIDNHLKNDRIEPDDTVICFNYRTDRCREITRALTQEPFEEYGMKPLPLRFATMTMYDQSFNNIEVLYHKDNLVKTIGEVISSHNKTQLRAAETEKYPHVTFFFNGGQETPFKGEDRMVVASPKIATYDLQPEMSAPKLTTEVCNALMKHAPDFLCLNFANPDMVGHTGVFEAVVKAVETTDTCLKKVLETGLNLGYEFVVIADHGNSDLMINPDGSVHTAHTLNLVPIVCVSKRLSSIKEGILADVAPTVLAMMGLEQPIEMTGKSLIEME